MTQSEKVLLNSNLIAQVKEANNFELIRLLLAYSVLFNHFSTLTDTTPFWFATAEYWVRSFFIISGFLVMFSFLRSSDIKIYIRKRVQRIMPAYILVVIGCILLGFFITTLSYKEYLTSSELYSYMVSNLLTLNFIQPNLPGVFENNPINAVNGSLWTIKVELMLYLTIPVIYWLLNKYNKLICLTSIYILSFIYSNLFNYLDDTTNQAIFGFMKRQFPGQMMYFCSGIIILAYFPTFIRHKKYILPASIILFILKDYMLFKIFEPIALATIIITIAYSFKRLNFFNKIGDSSYAIYLLHFPIIQTFIHFGLDKYNLVLTLILTVIVCTFLGLLSWKYVEKPCLYKPIRKK